MSIKIYSTVRDRNDRLTRQKDREFVPRPECMEDRDRGVVVDDAVHFQEIEGFGGALTESAAWVIAQMPPMRRKEILDAYFSELGYNYVRIHMNSCDFSLENYSYVADNDAELKTFSIAREERYVIPALREAWKRSPDMRLYFSPWSPPAWMKTNGEMNHGGRLKPECRALWAEYYCRFIEELEKRNCPVWGLSVQNEPMANQCFDSCVWTGREEMEFVRDYLGPALARHGFGDRKLMVFDHNRDQVYRRATTVYNDPEASKYVWGAAIHWYEGYCGSEMSYVLSDLHFRCPEKKIFFSEGCNGGNNRHLGSWEAGERYSSAIINDMNHFCCGWTDWNLVLDIATGGPRHVPNACGAPILCDIENGTVHYQPGFWHIGHTSRFVKRGARRIIASPEIAALKTVAFENPDGEIVAVVQNATDSEFKWHLHFRGQTLERKAFAHSIETFCFPK